MRRTFIFLTLSVTVLITACATNYVPSKKGKAKIENVAAFSNVGVISLINAQPNNKSVRIGSIVNMGSPHANYNAWTNIVIYHAEKALKEIGMQVAPDGNKVLHLKVVNVHITDGNYIGLLPVTRASCSVELEVKTALGYEQCYDETGKTFYAGWKAACDKAILEVVEVLLKDDRIISHLNK